MSSPYYVPPSLKKSVEEEEKRKAAEKQEFEEIEEVVENTPVVSSEPVVPIKRFQGSFIDTTLMENMRKMGIEKPTIVQKYALPLALQRKDLLFCAPTGMGKTASFLIPSLNYLVAERSKEKGRHHRKEFKRKTRILVIAPTRELCLQIHLDATNLAKNMSLVVRVIYGGKENRREQMDSLRSGADILVGAPGRLIDFLSRNIVAISEVDTLIFDEADRMMDMGFEPQIRDVLKYLKDNKRQTMMFSATFPPEVKKIAKEFFQNPHVQISIGEGTLANIEQEIIKVSTDKKEATLLGILRTKETNTAEDLDLQWKKKMEEEPLPESSIQRLVWRRGKPREASPLEAAMEKRREEILQSGLTIVFVETKSQCTNLEKVLERKNVLCTSIHGDKTQPVREEALRKFRAGEVPILIATSVAARGLDIGGVTTVINYEMPNDIKEYVHRIGRTGRAGSTGRSITFFTPNDKGMAKDLIAMMTSAKKTPPPFLVEYSKDQRYARDDRKKRGERGGKTRPENAEESLSLEKINIERGRLNVKSLGNWAEEDVGDVEDVEGSES